VTEYAWFGAQNNLATVRPRRSPCRVGNAEEFIVVVAERAEHNGFDNVLLPSGYSLGIDATAFASAIAVETTRIKLLLAVRLGELVVPQLARQIATLQQIAGGRLVINAISSDLPGETMSSEDRYQRTTEAIAVLRTLLRGVRTDTPRPATHRGGTAARPSHLFRWTL
jgi:alkanesulfonate monooxygenase SsuD/methylene tetrahydromethanopterin reductase-like flavin-dependent oxidoreductase (luciferase family)